MYEVEIRLSSHEGFSWSTANSRDQFEPNNKLVRGNLAPIEITGFCPQNFAEQQ